MLKKMIKRAFVFLLCVSFFIVNPHFNFLSAIYTYALPSSVSVKGTSVNVRSGPGTSYRILGTVSLGYRLMPLDVQNDVFANGKKWYKFSYNGQNAYIRTDFTKESVSYVYDAEFEAELSMKGFPESYKVGLRDLHANYPNWIFTLHNTGLDFNYVTDNELIGTRTLVNATSISSYKSTDEGKYDWVNSKWPTFDGNAWVAASREVTAAYLDPRNFLYDPYVFQFEHHTFNANIHSIAGIKEMVKGTFLDSNVTTEGLTSSVNAVDIGIMYPGTELVPWDPNTTVIPILMNDKEDDLVVGFSNVYYAPNGPGGSVEQLGPAAGLPNQNNSGQASVINPSAYSSGEDVEGSFQYSYMPKGTYSYAELIYDACRQVNCNPYCIVSMILQEQGKNGSDSVSGTNSKFKGYYNYGNINAFASNGYTAIENGLKYASQSGSYNRPWNSKEKGIYGLCDFYANSYVRSGQDTFYLKKWNVQGENLFKHQYMTNVAGAAAEGQLLGNAYDDIMMQMPHEFKIPIYNNMPETNCPMPTKDGSPNNKLKSLAVANYILTPTFDPDVSDYSIMLNADTNSVFINAEAFDKKAAVGGIGNVLTMTSYTVVTIYCVAENKDIRQYTISFFKPGVENVQVNPANLTPQILIPTNNGIIIGSQNNYIDSYGPGGQLNNAGNIPVVIGVGPGE